MQLKKTGGKLFTLVIDTFMIINPRLETDGFEEKGK